MARQFTSVDHAGGRFERPRRDETHRQQPRDPVVANVLARSFCAFRDQRRANLEAIAASLFLERSSRTFMFGRVVGAYICPNGSAAPVCFFELHRAKGSDRFARLTLQQRKEDDSPSFRRSFEAVAARAQSNDTCGTANPQGLVAQWKSRSTHSEVCN